MLTDLASHMLAMKLMRDRGIYHDNQWPGEPMSQSKRPLLYAEVKFVPDRYQQLHRVHTAYLATRAVRCIPLHRSDQGAISQLGRRMPSEDSDATAESSLASSGGDEGVRTDTGGRDAQTGRLDTPTTLTWTGHSGPRQPEVQPMTFPVRRKPLKWLCLRYFRE